MPRITFLGTNGWYDTDAGLTVCALLEYADFNIILDAGGGFANLEKYIDFDKPSYLFLSHLHLDHIQGLHALPKYIFKNGLSILISGTSSSALKTFMDFPYTAPLKLISEFMKYDLRIIDLPAKKGALPFGLSILPLVHTVETMAARIEAEGKIVSYVVDTGYCPNAVKAAWKADLLIAECSFRSGEEDPAWPHLNPEEAAGMALSSSCRKLALTHFDAKRYPTKASRKPSELIARKIFKDAVAAYDGLIIEF